MLRGGEAGAGEGSIQLDTGPGTMPLQTEILREVWAAER